VLTLAFDFRASVQIPRRKSCIVVRKIDGCLMIGHTVRRNVIRLKILKKRAFSCAWGGYWVLSTSFHIPK